MGPVVCTLQILCSKRLHNKLSGPSISFSKVSFTLSISTEWRQVFCRPVFALYRGLESRRCCSLWSLHGWYCYLAILFSCCKVEILRYLYTSVFWAYLVDFWDTKLRVFWSVRVNYLFVSKQNIQSNSEKCTHFNEVCFISFWMCLTCYQLLSVVIGFFSNSVQGFFFKH